jgi:transposase
MMNQEEYVDVRALENEGWTAVEIAEVTGFHPATIRKRLKEGPPTPVVVPDERRVMTTAWRARIEALLSAHPRLLAVSIHNKVRAEGFEGSYPTVVRAVRDVRGPRFRAAAAVSVPIHTDPGEEDQFDFANLDDVAARWGWEHPLRCFGAISCWPRERHWWFTTSEDQHHTFEGLARAFEAFGGVPAAARTDRMGALGTSQGRRFTLHPAAVGFAAHYGVKITTCQARDAKRKGKVERPFRQLRETFIPEIELDGIPADLDELNRRAQAWLDQRVHAVASRSTGVPPVERAAVERDFRAALPRVRFDTDYVETRRVHNVVPFIALDGVRYSVPPNVLGQLVEIRRPVDTDRFEVRWAGVVVARHTISDSGATEVWADDHRRASITEALGRHERRRQRHLHAVDNPVESGEGPGGPGRLDLGPGDYDVDRPDLAARYRVDGDQEGAGA